MIYKVICTLLRWFMRFFYPRVYILNQESIASNKPYLLVCNHQNSFMNAFILAIHFNTPLYFIKPVRQQINTFERLLMQSLHIVPLRKGWHRRGEEQHANPWNNLRDLITSNKPLVFFSESEDDQLKVSKGAAKIAFHTEEVFDFGLDIEMIPVTINYGKQGDAVIVLGQGIPVKSFEKDYRRQPARTIKYTTTYLEDELIQGCGSESAEFARLLGSFQRIANRKLPEESPTYITSALFSPINSALGKENPSLLKGRLHHFFRMLRKHGLQDWAPNRPSFLSMIITLLGAPFFALGFSINWLRYQASRLLSRILLPRHRHGDSSRMIIGLFLFPLIWTLIALLIAAKLGMYMGVLALMLLPLLAQFTYFYWIEASQVINFLHYLYLLRFHAAESRSIEQTYQEVLYLLRKTHPTLVFSI